MIVRKNLTPVPSGRSLKSPVEIELLGAAESIIVVKMIIKNICDVQSCIDKELF